MFRVLEPEIADALWRKVAARFRPGEGANRQAGCHADTTEVLHAAMPLADPEQRWIASRSPAMNPTSGLADVVWIVTGEDVPCNVIALLKLREPMAGAGLQFVPGCLTCAPCQRYAPSFRPPPRPDAARVSRWSQPWSSA